MNVKKLLAACLVAAAFTPVTVSAENMEKFFPVPACTAGWTIDGSITYFDKESLFDRINGESELYFPYGFERLAYGRYESKRHPSLAIDADVYKMGSLLDAFGMFANYRKKQDTIIAVGAEGTLSESQVFFYDDRYFVRLQVTGATAIDRATLLECAKAIAQRLPANANRPRELELFGVPGIAQGTERYIAQSVLGYEFFPRGLLAGFSNGTEEQVFIVFGRSTEEAKKIIRNYRDYLAAGGRVASYQEEKTGLSLEGNDPLYGAVLARQKYSIIAGVIRASSVNGVNELLNRVLAKVRTE
ncbi:MAG TPA: DUF6599 family protein [Nitrospirota bacterium]|nr:DUF6599 family protein [Nitrospirota bacterium]